MGDRVWVNAEGARERGRRREGGREGGRRCGIWVNAEKPKPLLQSKARLFQLPLTVNIEQRTENLPEGSRHGHSTAGLAGLPSRYRRDGLRACSAVHGCPAVAKPCRGRWGCPSRLCALIGFQVGLERLEDIPWRTKLVHPKRHSHAIRRSGATIHRATDCGRSCPFQSGLSTTYAYRATPPTCIR